MDDFQKELKKLDVGDFKTSEVTADHKNSEDITPAWFGGCFRCGGCGGCYRCGGCFRCAGCFGCFGCFW
ncbi:heterocycloanthracin/sonorensin family bacteriocin [Alicyclobacillus tolerans]|uniref:heterocycloanthracin/sonorensin family bacteriocin n=1 Tax=Alicyclobacillus tolerans TaxID=90970 RepID=UPI0027E1725F|nr:heterocycloanthracin/sonorensin family bacteriocin [Alicyclobacillus tolerans]MCF8564237.1 heterocycloanthracin/sonorensin family bacteriocin [Alicyclobacillus tolerans]